MTGGRKTRSFTLLEILVGLTIFGLVMPAASAVFYKAYRDWAKQRDYLRCLHDAFWAMEYMASEIRQSDAVPVESTAQVYHLRVDTAYATTPIWYWRGDRNKDQESSGEWGYRGYLYRAQTNNFCISIFGFCVTPDAYRNRQLMCRNVVNNVNGNNFYEVSGDVVTLELTLRPFPDVAEGPGNRNLNIRTAVRRRN